MEFWEACGDLWLNNETMTFGMNWNSNFDEWI